LQAIAERVLNRLIFLDFSDGLLQKQKKPQTLDL